ncbi:hypothetical protein COCC4DRAFT_69027 [Bipolaris maydis ATCC 48331]|uniref:DNA recombination and repair protein Rad51-like C-terminal domain-containing protein n=2 Tax=Cochliobolus heterostrophus TaxID=5016 RepID=M2U932_COCH5|nr:uncharacterized protein COCC4DRAFT_69027 [Bipolaris maydis ATCC 48331]EMD90261.1 hypothetical protein COCHEDRAFT_1139404 [Bipolaris maydis C5]KAJ5023887.1 hypothetical protein J3E73DRAFT_399950 [Bipolaris maydis]ENI09525.1 hypothetical protein COCC4DRAFT_69027 [Bipolaris maydis ATCC 48331]KAJ5058157.1 hypothetical protein J3E74DRAFT_436514 [Bipolaris maydis]KAJ6195406.1 hypothetical protein J3E72DRAFT_402260 [Bipolaris maydis]
MMMNGDEARKFGEKSLADVQVTDLNSVLKSLRLIHLSTTNQSTYFTIPPLDSLLLPSSTHPPILSLVSPPSAHQPSGSGKTSLVTLIIATALSTTTSNAIILIDPLHHFSIPLLSSTLLRIFSSTSTHPPPSPSAVKEKVRNALHHLHILHPTTFPTLISTLRSLPPYLFTPTAHPSTHRTIHSLILEDTDAFLPTLPSTSTPASASATLSFHLLNLSNMLSCAIITTSRAKSARYLRPAMPMWDRDVRETRVALRKVEATKFGAGLSLDEVERETAESWAVVREGCCEASRVSGAGVQQASTGPPFLINIGVNGVEIKDKEKNK